MRLILTRYLNTTPNVVAEKLDRAVSAGLDVASDRIAGDRGETRTEEISQGLRVSKGLTSLDGSEVRVHEDGPLTTLEVAVPWTEADTGSPKLWAAVRFTEMIVDEVSVAA